jgi:peroxiredoxin Q/BCP
VVVRYPNVAALVAAIGLASAALAFGQTPVDLKPGDTAPDFSLPGSDGKTYKLSELRGKTVVLAWFPKAFTGG